MALTKSEFKILSALHDDGRRSSLHSLRALADRTGLSLGGVHALCHDLGTRGLIDGFRLTAAGYGALSPYRVSNAIIMAAGLSSRFVPLSYEKPKGVLKVCGEVLIERQIRQLKAAGIDDITVVVGYMKEAFFYLEELFGVSIRVNEEYASRNNNSTLMLVREKLGNTYICSSDNYFSENVFEPFVFEAYYAGVFFEGPTDEYCMETLPNGQIVDVSIGGSDAYGMLGHAYFDKAFSQAFRAILEREYDRPETAAKLWEDIYRDHLKELSLAMRPYAPGTIYEFDSLSDLNQFDQDFLLNVDSEILDNICKVINCDRSRVEHIVAIKEGLTNLSFRFSVGQGTYVYRHPGPGTGEIINRQSEAYSQAVAKKLGIDDTFIFQDSHKGWKISRYVQGCKPFDYHDEAQVERAMELIRRLHRSSESSPWTYDLFEKAQSMLRLLDARSYPSFSEYELLHDYAARLDEFVKKDGVEPCLCHNDFYEANFLVSEGEMFLIDWEYSAMSDYASDLGVFICCSDFDEHEADRVFQMYFQRVPTDEEYRHCVAYVALASYHWFIWALYKESLGDSVGEWQYMWYRYAKTYSVKALALYGGET